LTPTIFVADRDLPPSLPSTQVAFEGQATDWPKYQPPPEEVPFGAHPYDHYFLTRPVDVSANSEYLFYYPYGSSGSDGIRVHHGIDIPNFVGQEVRAAGSGTVIWAGDGLTGERAPELGLYASYGNVIIIQHDFSWRGKPVWTLYAHLSAILVQENERVDTGRIIGLVGVSGLVTGPHVHFEVRVANNSYYSTRNPLLWMAPYIGHGVLAGRVVDQSGAFVEKASLRLFQDGVLTDRTTSYQDAYRPGRRVWSVVPDDNWRENFVLGDIPAGEYTLVATLDDFRVERPVTINPSVTTFVELVFYDRDIRATFVPPLATPLPTSTP
jgi:murein DD-endopeptidase MepM/ murein hydrolase activator NlpD